MFRAMSLHQGLQEWYLRGYQTKAFGNARLALAILLERF